MEPIYYRPQKMWGPDEFYGLYRYLDRMFSSRRSHREDEIRSLDLARMSVETKHLMKHLLIVQGNFRYAMKQYPNLRPLMTTEAPDKPIVLREPPRYKSSYFARNGIIF